MGSPTPPEKWRHPHHNPPRDFKRGLPASPPPFFQAHSLPEVHSAPTALSTLHQTPSHPQPFFPPATSAPLYQATLLAQPQPPPFLRASETTRDEDVGGLAHPRWVGVNTTETLVWVCPTVPPLWRHATPETYLRRNVDGAKKKSFIGHGFLKLWKKVFASVL